MFSVFDLNHDGKIDVNEFVNGLTKWLDDAKNVLDTRCHSRRSLKDLYEVVISLATWSIIVLFNFTNFNFMS